MGARPLDVDEVEDDQHGRADNEAREADHSEHECDGRRAGRRQVELELRHVDGAVCHVDGAWGDGASGDGVG